MKIVLAQNAPGYAAKGEFYRAVVKNVNAYFVTRGLQKTGTPFLYARAAYFLFLHVNLYVLSIFPSMPFGVRITAAVLMGIYTFPGIGFCIMHTATHGTFSSRKWVNTVLSYSGSILGMFMPWWRIQHNTLHHSHTNVVGFDTDMDLWPMVRTSTQGKQEIPYWIHRYQHIYAWFLYCLQSLHWVWWSDLTRLVKGRIGPAQFKVTIAMVLEFILVKIFHFVVYIYIPCALLGIHDSIWQYLTIMLISGLALSSVFQCAHVEEGIPILEKEEVTGDWITHEMCTTKNFGKDNTLLSFYVGGLNRQVEHHLFFNQISDDHYSRIGWIVRRTAAKHGVEYNAHPTFFDALVDHGRQLKKLGKI